MKNITGEIYSFFGDGLKLRLNFHTFMTKWMVALHNCQKTWEMTVVVGLLSLIGHLNVYIMKTALDKVINCSFPVKWRLSSLPLINYILLVKTLSFSVSWYKFSDLSNVDSSPATQHLVLFCFKTIKFTIFKISNQQTCFHYFCFKLVYQVGLTLHTFWISWMKLST